ncbi:putative ABC transporter [Parvularcula bermudensis HTCC2503]|uniref:Putative ABC transporter n=1 Tax=Parvularcula bermudensis (strain ATCC BAA-594 / HTCC2503 / KCTC 12087) TaxID=314260 RepID=E0TG38_PARBH|nr:ABC transporter ATP-binding protein [Parvularcula bermudensis]ADM10609.1 putative ABC transporter [Parvularcula bermudensis HTCC2503]
MDNAIDLQGIRFGYRRAQTPLLVVDSFAVKAGEKVLLEGPSGSGKSTLLGVIAGTLVPQQGTVTVLGHPLTTMSGRQRDRLRADQLGVIFQMFNLIPYLSVIDNVLLPTRFSPRRRQAVLKTAPLTSAARDLLGRLGLDDPDLLRRAVSELSVGQQQRVAAARALIGQPGLIIADEPTSALDPVSQDLFLSLLTAETERSGAALLFVSHDDRLRSHFDRRVSLDSLSPASHSAAA